MDNLDNMHAIEQSLENQLNRAGYIKIRQQGKPARATTAMNPAGGGGIYRMYSRPSITNARTRIRQLNQSQMTKSNPGITIQGMMTDTNQ